jgi:hypothetical protein
VANSIDRPFDNFRTAITDPPYFFGRTKILEEVHRYPFQFRILLGGRRLGKTSLLRAAEWSLLNPESSLPRRAFPVLISLELEQPDSLGNLLYILVARLREAMDRWNQVFALELRAIYQRYLRQIAGAEATIGFLKLKINNPANERRLINDDFRISLIHTVEELREWGFEGVCFLMDEAEFIVRQTWADDAWSYFRALKDNDTALKPFLGFLSTGYRGIKEYSQKVGSPILNIAKVEWLNVLTEQEACDLIANRAETEGIGLSYEDNQGVLQIAGCHPFLTQQLLNVVCDHRKITEGCQVQDLLPELLRQRENDFHRWWNMDNRSDGFGELERKAYCEIKRCNETSISKLEEALGVSYGKIANALEILTGTGVIRQVDDEDYTIGSQLFQIWVAKQS